MSGSAAIAIRRLPSRCWPRSSSGSLSRAHSSHSSRCWPARTSRCRRWSPLLSATRTGRHRSVGGSSCSAARRYSTRSRARVRLSEAATAPAVLPRRSASVRVSVPVTSCSSSVCRSRSPRRARAVAMADCSSSRTTRRSGSSGVVRSSTRCWLRRFRSSSRHMEATTLRAVTMAYGSSMPGSTVGRAASTRVSVSWTRSSPAGWVPTRALTMRRTMGIRSATVSARRAGSSPARSATLTGGTYPLAPFGSSVTCREATARSRGRAGRGGARAPPRTPPRCGPR